MKRTVMLILICILAGCSSEPDSNVALNDQPISIEAWQELEVAEKYAPETLDRLKLNDPRLENERNWNRFMRSVVVPARRKDIPTDY